MGKHYDIGDALSRIEQILLNSMQRNLHRHLHEEQDEGLRWTMWQTEQLTALRTWSARNLKAHTPAFTKINDAAIRLLEDSGKQAELAEERQLLADGVQQAGAFFNVPEDKVQALLTSVRHDLSRAEHSILRQADDVYRKAVFDAQVYLQTGSGTLENAIDMAVQDLQKNGIRSVVYRNGRRVEASAYARMALRSANVRARIAGEGKIRDKYGIHTVIAPPSGIACEKCVKWLCRVMVDDVYCSGTAAEAEVLGVPLLSQAIAQGFLHPQCNCSLHTYHAGSPVLEMSQEERDEAVRKYRLTQKQRYNERQIRKWKRAEQSAPDETARKAAAARCREWQTVNKQLCDEHHDFLRRDYGREKIYDAPERVIVPDVIEIQRNIPSLSIIVDEGMKKQGDGIWTKIRELLDIPTRNGIMEERELETALKSIGFESVDQSFFKKVDKRLQLSITDQLKMLEDKFGAVHASISPTIAADCEGGSVACVSRSTTNSAMQRLRLSATKFKNWKSHIKQRKQEVEIGHCMPCAIDNMTLSHYVVTHEYGHMLENSLISQDLTERLGDFKDMAKFYKQQIVEIAKEIDADFEESKYISRYGTSNDREFFAECFANSQLGTPNVLGRAMLIWLGRRGF